jgi:hypothetical protein
MRPLAQRTFAPRTATQPLRALWITTTLLAPLLPPSLAGATTPPAEGQRVTKSWVEVDHRIHPGRMKPLIHDGRLHLRVGNRVELLPHPDLPPGGLDVRGEGRRLGMILEAGNTRVLSLLTGAESAVHLEVEAGQEPSVTVLSGSGAQRESATYGLAPGTNLHQMLAEVAPHAIAATHIESRRIGRTPGEVWAIIDGQAYDLAHTEPFALEPWQRTVLGGQLDGAAGVLRLASIPTTAVQLPRAALDALGIGDVISARGQGQAENQSELVRKVMAKWGLPRQ